jgi:hypothetical protein
LEELWQTWIAPWMKVECEYGYLTYFLGLKYMQCTFQTMQIILHNSHRIHLLVKCCCKEVALLPFIVLITSISHALLLKIQTE